MWEDVGRVLATRRGSGRVGAWAGGVVYGCHSGGTGFLIGSPNNFGPVLAPKSKIFLFQPFLAKLAGPLFLVSQPSGSR